MSRTLLLYLGALGLRSIAIGLLAGIVTFRMRRVASRHAVWAAVLGAMLLLPAVDAILPVALVPKPVQQVVEPLPSLNVLMPALAVSTVQPISVATTPARNTKQTDYWVVGAILYICVAGVLLLRLGFAHRRIVQITRAARPVFTPALRNIAAAHGMTGSLPQIRETDVVRVPLTIGIRKPVVLLPADWRDWDDWKLGAVLSHELAHIRRFDWAIAVIASFNSCAFWFNPLSWWLENHLSILAEKASDDASVAITGDSTRYAEVLLEFAVAAQSGERIHAGSVAMARTKIRTRIERVLETRRPQNGVLTKVGWILVMSLFAPVLYAASAMHVVPTGMIFPPEILRPIGFVAMPAAPVEEPRPVVVRRQPAPITQLKVLQSVRPIYPSLAMAARIQGVVDLDVTVGADGHPTDVRVISGHPLLQEAAIDAARQWVFDVEGQKVPARTTASVNFIYTAGDVSAAAMTRQVEEWRAGSSSMLKTRKEVPARIPPLAQQARISGVVILRVTVGPDGRPAEMIVVSGHPLLQQAAIDAVRQWEFEAAGITTVTVPIKFDPSVPRSTTPISFSFLGVQDRNVRFERTDAGAAATSMSYGCPDCTFVITEFGVVADGRTGPGVGVHLSSDARELDLTCRASECVIATTLPTGANYVQTLQTNASTKVPTSAKVSITINR